MLIIVKEAKYTDDIDKKKKANSKEIDINKKLINKKVINEPNIVIDALCITSEGRPKYSWTKLLIPMY
ncbi:hypothetical protein PIROE2DRAFT_12138 [Piromyces sp. E2]|nr:hypothetical protein PIROE2DRAFT_12138 [Piromyces sp. E2]|eukprot:OUM61781.1 hypothetical protein PIROE2DRAFT_12138 [Piromyces sp. E2]